uniref:G-protein coupled receptors family 1 profile domain-containing protein n=1 Tax=Cricetulus griseus TaxID=10029 RepID=A0A8C2MNC6_CRIGR
MGNGTGSLLLPLLFLFLIYIYMVAVVGNLGMTLLIRVSPLLHTPMYYFLSSLSFVNLYSTVITPKMLVNFLGKINLIFYSECMAQPLMYNVIMSSRLCSLLVLVSFILGLWSDIAHKSAMMKLSFCKSHIIRFHSLVSTLSVSISYAFCTILSIRSTEGLSKAFGTCSSHLMAVGIFFGSLTFMHFKPPSSNTLEEEKLSLVFYTTVIPMLNPLIYSLRNKDVKKALGKFLVNR